jgi:hypothetical protein
LVPLIALALVAPLSSVPPQQGVRAGVIKVLRAVWLPGFGSALSTVGFGAMIAFSSLLSAQNGGSPVWLTFSAFSFQRGLELADNPRHAYGSHAIDIPRAGAHVLGRNMTHSTRYRCLPRSPAQISPVDFCITATF